jgi:DNA-binding PadR family transcriptional regulator
MYRLIGRLEDQGLVAPAKDARADEGGDDPRRRYYELTDLGRDVVRAEARRLTDLVAHPDVAALAAEVGS